ncbi:uncharacterized protein LOC143589624 [Bidens hawaiensis]|uniref:uncharacterized protein LOC143589624 n=1 Tax=Bidens hawaiensis TaxID=980011 RepID=UPI00404B5816
MAVFRAKKFTKRTGRNNWNVPANQKVGFNKSSLRCYNCHDPGHFARECTNPAKEGNRERAMILVNGGREENVDSSSVGEPGLVVQNFSWEDQMAALNLSDQVANFAKFHGREDEDAPAHINHLTRVFKTFNLQGANRDAIFLHLFPFTLSDRAATWLDSQPAGTFTTWEALRNAFLKKYFPPAKASRLRDQIHTFHMEPDEPYYQAWKRFQNLAQARFDTAAGGNLIDKKNVTECNELFESFAQSEYAKKPRGGNSNPATSTPSSTRGVHQVNLDTGMAAALENLTQEIKELRAKVNKCEMCRGGHGTLNCPLMNNQNVEYVAGQNRFPNAYNNNNQNWNSYKNQNQGQDNSNWRPAGGPPGFQAPYNRNQGQFSGSIKQNPSSQINAISARSGRVLGPEREIEVEESEELVDEDIVMETPGRVQPRLDPASTAPTSESIVRGSEENKPRDVRPSPLIDHSRLSYPARAKNQKFRREYGNFLDMFRQLRINLPFIEALQHMPKYAKFLKDILKRKECLEELSTVPLNRECSAVVLNKVPEKLPDPGVFIVPCLFGRDTSCQALADLGASINLMPYSLF